jgi:DNA-binding CsgD family transcriptional regulator
MPRAQELRSETQHQFRRRPIRIAWKDARPDQSLRDSGIDLLGQVPWGTHFSVFYETRQDLFDANACFFKAARNEACFWAVADQIPTNAARDALRPHLPDFDRRLASGQVEIVPGHDLYRKPGRVDCKAVMEALEAKAEAALAVGYDGVRLSGSPLWHHAAIWKDFREYEQTLDSFVTRYRMLVMCTYSLLESPARDLIDVTRAHQCAIVIRNGEWDFFNAPAARKARHEIDILNTDLDPLKAAFPGKDLLTLREKVVLAQILKGASSKTAARDLGISPRTVEFHRANIMAKLGVRNLVELTRLVLAS